MIMSFIYRKEEKTLAASQQSMDIPGEERETWKTAFHFISLLGILIFATWGKPEENSGFFHFVFIYKWFITSFFALMTAISLAFIIKLKKIYVLSGLLVVILSAILWNENPLIPFITGIIVLTILLSFGNDEAQDWLGETWGFTRKIMPLLFGGVLIAGFLLGNPESGGGIIPDDWIAGLVGGNSFGANFFASFAGAFMYFATLTEVPILQGLIAGGMGKGPALALLLAGPALSLPNILVIRSVIGGQKTTVYVGLVIIMATISGLLFGNLF